MKKCICENCEDCRLYLPWIMKNDHGEQKVVNQCAILIIAEEIPKFRGAVDGCQSAVNETRNRVMEYGTASVEAIEAIPNFVKAVAIRTLEHANIDTK